MFVALYGMCFMWLFWIWV